MTNRSYNLIFGAVLVVILGLVALILFLLLPRILDGQIVASSPEAAAQIGDSITGYRLPTGYLEQQALDLGVFTQVFITPNGEAPDYHVRQIIVMTAYPDSHDVSDEQVAVELRSALLKLNDDVSTMGTVAERAAVIKGEAVTLTVHESFGESDSPVRMVLTPVFRGLEDKVIIVFAGPIAGWNQGVVDQFLSSIR
jgi:hypothetical protein